MFSETSHANISITLHFWKMCRNACIGIYFETSIWWNNNNPKLRVSEDLWYFDVLDLFNIFEWHSCRDRIFHQVICSANACSSWPCWSQEFHPNWPCTACAILCHLPVCLSAGSWITKGGRAQSQRWAMGWGWTKHGLTHSTALPTPGHALSCWCCVGSHEEPCSWWGRMTPDDSPVMREARTAAVPPCGRTGRMFSQQCS